MNSVTGDQEVYLKSVSDNSDESPITSRDVLWINDQNNGSYNGQITFDTSLFNSSSKWLNYSEAYLEVPFVVSVKASVDASAADIIGPYFAGLKAGYHEIIDSVSVEYGTKNVVQLQSYVNFHTQFKLMTSFSKDDLQKYGPSIGFYPDSAGSYQFNAAASNFGDGYSNVDEVYEIQANTSVRPESFNEGFLKRRAMTTAFKGDGGYGSLTTINTADKCRRIGKNYFIADAGAGADRVYSWYIIATIRLKDLSEFFAKVPLVKNGSMRITLNYNSSTTKIDITAAGASSIDTHTQSSGHTNPVMIGQSLVSGPKVLPVGAGAAYTIDISNGVMNNSLNTKGNGGFAITSARLYVPSYKLDPKRELALITKNPITKVTYNDIYSYRFTITESESFNQILTNGIVDAQYLLLMPFIAPKSDSTTKALRISPYQSLFDSAGGTTSPMCALTELQVTLGGENVYTQNERYDYEAFLNELARINALLGGVTTGLTSGLLDAYMFDNAYRYYIADLSRRNSAEDLVPKAIHVSGTNVTGLPLEIIAFVAYRRHLNIDTLTGMELN
jgi:hypothetical protein